MAITYITGVIRFIERNDRERISNGGQVLRDDREGLVTDRERHLL